MILFLTNNYKETKGLYIWLKKNGFKVRLVSTKLDKDDLKNVKFVISYNYRYIIPKDLLQLTKFVNLHISYLPYNRGAHPNIWSFIENTPKGVTIHYIDEGIDTGEILFQKKVAIKKSETLKSSYKKLHRHIQRLFKKNFKKIISNRCISKKQKGIGSIHYKKDIETLKLCSYDMTIEEFLDANRKV